MVTRFDSRPLPEGLSTALRARLEREHRERPFSTVDCRETVRRVEAILESFDVSATVYRGGLDLRGAEVDHVWVAVRPEAREDARGYVLDVAFPLFAEDFVATLRRFVAGDAADAELAAAAAPAGVEARVVGVFPARLRYLGQPVWYAGTR